MSLAVALSWRVFMSIGVGPRKWVEGGSERRQAGGRGGVLDRDGEADAQEGARRRRVEDGGDDAHHLAVHGDERPARVARIGGGVELDQVGHLLLALGR